MDFGGRFGIRVQYDHIGVGMLNFPGRIKRSGMEVATSPAPRFDLRSELFEKAGDSSEMIRSEVEADLTEFEQVEFLVYDRRLVPINWHS
jgi:hypothetical protein